MIHKETLLVNKMLSFEVNHQHLSAYWKNLLEACTSPILLVLFFILVFKNVAKMWFYVSFTMRRQKETQKSSSTAPVEFSSTFNTIVLILEEAQLQLLLYCVFVV